MSRALALICCLAAPAVAEKLSYQHENWETVHIANNEGAINTADDLTVSIDLTDKKHVEITATGNSKEHNLFHDGRNTDDVSAWTTTWKGTYTRTAKALVMDLELGKHDCTASRTEDSFAPEPRPCKQPSKHAKVSCMSESVEIDQKKVAAWRCLTDDKTDLAETAPSWLVGKTQCIRSKGGHRSPESFEACPITAER
ncbi:MAG TPA: hypothetical protein VGC41_15310 [Kofleriaceae bacterium]